MDLISLLPIIVCPACKGKLEIIAPEKKLVCENCRERYDIINGIPILLDDDSKKNLKRFLNENSQNIETEHSNQKLSFLQIFLKEISGKFNQAPATKIGDKRIENIKKVQKNLPEKILEPKLLIIGSFLPQNWKKTPEIEEICNYFKDSIRLDISLKSYVNVMGDGHRLPFADNTFDAVIAQAVIKHLRNPNRFVNEVYRVLKNGGIVYAECPFLITFHRWPGDYVRYSPIGFKELFKDFKIIEAGFTRGPSQTMADLLSIYFACIFSLNNKYLYSVFVKIFSWIFHPMKIIDYYLIHVKWADLLTWVNYLIGKKNGD